MQTEVQEPKSNADEENKENNNLLQVSYVPKCRKRAYRYRGPRMGRGGAHWKKN